MGEVEGANNSEVLGLEVTIFATSAGALAGKQLPVSRYPDVNG